MHDIETLIQQHGLAVVFAAVLVESLGLPVPSFAVVLVAAGSLSALANGPAMVLAVAFIAGLAGDLIWYSAGLRYGYRIIGTLCRVSMSTDSCVQKTESIFIRWGPSSLLVSRFVPGFSVVAQPLAGAVRQPLVTFFIYDSLGTLIWCASAVVLGVVFSNAVDEVLETLSRYGSMGVALIAGGVVAMLIYKWTRRQLFIRTLRMARITVDELSSRMRRGEALVILDVRPTEVQAREGIIPGAVAVSSGNLDSLAMSFDSTADIVVYCSCPNEASAATIARLLLNKGARRVRPLLGGIEAWRAAGLDLASFSETLVRSSEAQSATRSSETPIQVLASGRSVKPPTDSLIPR